MENFSQIDDILLTKFLTGETSEKENEEVEIWLKNDVKNQQYFDELQSVWMLTAKTEVPAVSVNVDKAWERMSQQIEEKNTTKVVTFSPWYKYSAGVAAIVLVFFGIRWYSGQQATPIETTKFVAVDVPQLDTLTDGSLITLNAGTTLAVNSFEGNSREMELDGEAYFEVAHNEDQPFIVHTQYGDVTVLGTKFNVNTSSGKVEVTVTEGLVKLTSKEDKYVLLKKGTQGIAALDTSTPKKKEINTVNEMFWKYQKLNFKNDSFDEVISAIAKAYKVDIQVKNENLYRNKVTSSFDHEKIESVFEVLEATLGIRVQKTGDKAYLID
ncbi:FecR family protein [Flammeovirga agarivorans]|uniref:DUF4974 domain-containing protein n=1 Tax=Flammeovirga agarivorans TaxID=2726742 RepID=A0A7X8SH87_9BACT|nr:FecR domain-containing protein [Flammeovirga agarivorans]NLR90206.1 DUF4974 domain-containing protein [Flammeovirga agarivorans]